MDLLSSNLPKIIFCSLIVRIRNSHRISHQILYVYSCHFHQFRVGCCTISEITVYLEFMVLLVTFLLIPYPLKSQSTSMSHATPIDCVIIGSRTSPLGCCFATFRQSRITQPLLGISCLQSRDDSSMTLKIRMPLLL
jgi:hypothetical protein